MDRLDQLLETCNVFVGYRKRKRSDLAVDWLKRFKRSFVHLPIGKLVGIFDENLIEHQLTFVIMECDLLARILSVPVILRFSGLEVDDMHIPFFLDHLVDLARELDVFENDALSAKMCALRSHHPFLFDRLIEEANEISL